MSDVLTIKVPAYRERVKAARKSLGRPSALDEAMVDLGIDTFLHLLDGGVVEIDGKLMELKESTR